MTRAILIAMLAWLAVAVAADVALVPSEPTQATSAMAKGDRLDADARAAIAEATDALEMWLEQFRAEMDEATECRKFWHEVAAARGDSKGAER